MNSHLLWEMEVKSEMQAWIHQPFLSAVAICKPLSISRQLLIVQGCEISYCNFNSMNILQFLFSSWSFHLTVRCCYYYELLTMSVFCYLVKWLILPLEVNYCPLWLIHSLTFPNEYNQAYIWKHKLNRVKNIA